MILVHQLHTSVSTTKKHQHLFKISILSYKHTSTTKISSTNKTKHCNAYETRSQVRKIKFYSKTIKNIKKYLIFLQTSSHTKKKYSIIWEQMYLKAILLYYKIAQRKDLMADFLDHLPILESCMEKLERYILSTAIQDTKLCHGSLSIHQYDLHQFITTNHLDELRQINFDLPILMETTLSNSTIKHLMTKKAKHIYQLKYVMICVIDLSTESSSSKQIS